MEEFKKTFSEWIRTDKVDKKLAFEYFIFNLIKWWGELNPTKEFEENDLSSLKVLKILFFVSAVGSNREEDGLLKIFKNWMAMPYGHVEIDVYKMMRDKEQFNWFEITNKRIILKCLPPFL